MSKKRATKPKAATKPKTAHSWQRLAQFRALIAAGDHMMNLLVSFGIISSGMATWEEAKERLSEMLKEAEL